MARIALTSLFLLISWHIIEPSTQEREVLIRDRLVLVLCDQIDQYITSGTFPAPVKKMPEKYKSIKPGVAGSIKGFKVIFPGGGAKKKRETTHPILDLLYY